MWRLSVDKTKREAVGTEECTRKDAVLINKEPLLHRGHRVRLQ